MQIGPAPISIRIREHRVFINGRYVIELLRIAEWSGTRYRYIILQNSSSADVLHFHTRTSPTQYSTIRHESKAKDYCLLYFTIKVCFDSSLLTLKYLKSRHRPVTSNTTKYLAVVGSINIGWKSRSESSPFGTFIFDFRISNFTRIALKSTV